jgi:hypothetical protein
MRFLSTAATVQPDPPVSGAEMFGNSWDSVCTHAGASSAVAGKRLVMRLCGLAFSVQTGAWWTKRAKG